MTLYFSATSANNKATLYYALMLLGETGEIGEARDTPPCVKSEARGKGELGDGARFILEAENE